MLSLNIRNLTRLHYDKLWGCLHLALTCIRRASRVTTMWSDLTYLLNMQLNACSTRKKMFFFRKERNNFLGDICWIYKKAKIIENWSLIAFHSVFWVPPNSTTLKIEQFCQAVWENFSPCCFGSWSFCFCFFLCFKYLKPSAIWFHYI